MYLKALGGAVAAAFIMVGSTAFAVTVIDDFTDAQFVVDEPFAPESNTSTLTGLAGVLGGQRTMTVENTTQSGASAVGDTKLESGAGEIIFSNDGNAEGTATVVYGESGGLGDLTGNGDLFYFELGTAVEFLGQVNFSVTLEDGSGGSATYTELVTPAFNPYLSFSEFAGIDFADITTMTVVVSSTGLGGGVDGSLASISVVPLPAAGLLLIGGLGALGGLRRKRRRADA